MERRENKLNLIIVIPSWINNRLLIFVQLTNVGNFRNITQIASFQKYFERQEGTNSEHILWPSYLARLQLFSVEIQPSLFNNKLQNSKWVLELFTKEIINFIVILVRLGSRWLSVIPLSRTAKNSLFFAIYGSPGFRIYSPSTIIVGKFCNSRIYLTFKSELPARIDSESAGNFKINCHYFCQIFARLIEDFIKLFIF